MPDKKRTPMTGRLGRGADAFFDLTGVEEEQQDVATEERKDVGTEQQATVTTDRRSDVQTVEQQSVPTPQQVDVSPSQQSKVPRNKRSHQKNTQTVEQPDVEALERIARERGTTKITVAIYDDQVNAIEDEVNKRIRAWKKQGIKVDKRKYDKSIILREALDEWLAKRE